MVHNLYVYVSGQNPSVDTQISSFPSPMFFTGHQFRAHKAVLAACSQFFHKFFQDFTQEPMVEIEGIALCQFKV